VGPLSRVNNCDYMDAPLAEKERQEFMKLGEGRLVNATMAYHWARLIELLYSAEKIQELLNDKDLQGTELVREGKHRGEGVGIVEAPRGTLFHHYQVNATDQVTMANLIVSTTSNNEPMNRAVQKVAKDYLEGKEITEGLLNHVEVAIRAYDPCLSCATHAVGRMPLEVRLEDADGGLIQERARG
jgi:NAD-reducing hydrogenase large subunit